MKKNRKGKIDAAKYAGTGQLPITRQTKGAGEGQGA
jgi:hypothetical protein